MFLCGLVQLYMTVFFKLHNTIWASINNIQLSISQFVYSARCSYHYVLHLLLTVTYSNTQEHGGMNGIGTMKKLRDEVKLWYICVAQSHKLCTASLLLYLCKTPSLNNYNTVHHTDRHLQHSIAQASIPVFLKLWDAILLSILKYIHLSQDFRFLFRSQSTV